MSFCAEVIVLSWLFVCFVRRHMVLTALVSVNVSYLSYFLYYQTVDDPVL